ncbi:contact-dependent growth inhibition system immunity protein [Streptomyces sp. NPDC050738]|uniref:contact-dependent growth inhibition system immunity protein n=1 Tax=Streptomyces sp. NPDC050738 TaxID=3154744 RepID=UPI00341C6C6F
MTRTMALNDRFKELRQLLASYEVTGNTFDDTPDRAGAALRAYQRSAGRDPARVQAVLNEIDDLLAVGLFSDQIADDVELLPHITPTKGLSVEESLRLIRQHLVRFTEAQDSGQSVRPETSWEWRETFPGLRHLFGAYFHQDFNLEYANHSEAIDDWLADSSAAEVQQLCTEIEEFVVVNKSATELKEAARALGLAVLPPDGASLRLWLTNIEDAVTGNATQ